MKNRRDLLFLLLLLLALPCFAQQKAKFHIVSFAENPHDTSPQIYEKLDSDGHPYAIIKVKSDNPDDDLRAYNFSFGFIPHMVDVKDAELWLYVGRNAKSVSINREGYQSIQRYDLGLTIQPGRAYDMRLSAESQKIMKQMVRFNISPVEAEAVVMFCSENEGGEESVFGYADENGSVAKLLPLGNYVYKVKSEYWYTSEGRVVLDGSKKVYEDNVILRPNFANVELKAASETDIYLDGMLLGKTTWRGKLKKGSYNVECRRDAHRNSLETIVVEDGKEMIVELKALTPITGSIAVNSTPLDVQITIDGKDYGKTPSIIDSLIIGVHKLTLSKDGYVSALIDVVINEGEINEQNLTLQSVDDAVLIPVVDSNGKWGFDTKGGKEVIECKYDDADAFFGGLAAVKKGGKWGVIDKSGNEVIECKYDDAGIPIAGLAKVKKGGKWGVIYKSGNEVIECDYDSISLFSNDGMAAVEKGGKWGFIDKSGNEVIKCKYDYAGFFRDGLAKFKKGGKWGFIDKSGNEVIECKYYDAGTFSAGLATVKKDGKWGFIDKSGNEVIKCKYDYAFYFKEGLAAVKKGGKWGFIDKSGNEVIKCKYDDVFSFFDGLAKVKKGGKCGFIDKSGNEVIKCKYDYAFMFFDGLAEVEKGGKCGFIDKSGNEVIKCKYDDVFSFFDGLAKVKKGGKCGFIDKSGNEVIECKYDDAYIISDGLVKVKKDGKRFCIDKTGKEYIKE